MKRLFFFQLLAARTKKRILEIRIHNSWRNSIENIPDGSSVDFRVTFHRNYASRWRESWRQRNSMFRTKLCQKCTKIFVENKLFLKEFILSKISYFLVVYQFHNIDVTHGHIVGMLNIFFPNQVSVPSMYISPSLSC